ncbi:MAG: FACT complex component POB3 [Amphiamblys sp. WSBS2006]|nr:MAG: FACT complex component POB3 [Amphiamblys sp. WSBS2006]
MSEKESIVFEDVCMVQDYFSVTDGKLKFVPGGVGFKNNVSGEIKTLETEKIASCSWRRCIREYQLEIADLAGEKIVFQNLKREKLSEIRSFVKKNYGKDIETKEIACSGDNVGEIGFHDTGLEFLVDSQTAFEIPFRDVTGSAVKEKNEISIELRTLDSEQNDTKDYLAEVRFCVVDSEDEDRALAISETIKRAANTVETAGKALATIGEFSCLVPRGKYQLDIMEGSIRLHGKTYDYNIQKTTIKNLFLLPLPDLTRFFFVFGVEPAARKEQTRYPFFVSQLSADEEAEVEIEGGKTYSGKTHAVLSSLFSDMAGVETVVAGGWKGASGAECVKCANKTNEGWLYLLDDFAVFLPKQVLVIRHQDISSVAVFRFDASTRTARTFDVKIYLRTKQTHQFSNILKNEFGPLSQFFKEKGIGFHIEKEGQDRQQPDMSSEGEEETSDGSYNDGEGSEEGSDEENGEGSDEENGEESGESD